MLCLQIWDRLSSSTTAFCDHAFYDQQNKMCIIGIYDYFVFPQLPIGLVTKVALRLVRGVGEYDLRYQLKAPDGNVIETFSDKYVFQDLNDARGFIWTLNFGVTVPGKYELEIYANDQRVGSRPLMVMMASA